MFSVNLQLPNAQRVGWNRNGFYVAKKIDSANQVQESNEGKQLRLSEYPGYRFELGVR